MRRRGNAEIVGVALAATVLMDLTAARKLMVDRDIRGRGVRDPRVLDALAQVAREAFISADLVDVAYDDRPLPIEAGQTISQPYIVAVMAEALRLTASDRVLEIGTGSGYAAAVLARVAAQVFTIERHAELAESARERLGRLGFDNVEVRCADGTCRFASRASERTSTGARSSVRFSSYP